MNPRIPKWLIVVCATIMLAACNADTSVVGPAVDAPAFSPRTQNTITVQPSVSDEAAGKQPSSQRGRGRYAMAAS